jgi:hypothetical protein
MESLRFFETSVAVSHVGYVALTTLSVDGTLRRLLNSYRRVEQSIRHGDLKDLNFHHLRCKIL